jgi:SP family general alpha glucoside:H+ symporter-like MFS transporter
VVGTIIEFFSPNWKVWIVAKICFGCATSFMLGNTSVYVSELSPVHIRGFMLSLFQLWINVGSFFASCVLESTSRVDGPWSWRAAIISQIGLGSICLVVFLALIPESPYYLLTKSRPEEAKKVLLVLRGREANYDVDKDLKIMEDSNEWPD